MEGRLLARARERLEAQRAQNKRTEQLRLEEINASLPEIREINSRLHAIMPELVGLALGQRGRTAEEMAEESLSLQSRRAALLRSHGYPENYLDEIFSCSLCRDTGYRENGKICECLTALYKQEQTKELSPLLKNGSETFESFRLDYYAAAPLREGEPSPRTQMERVFRYCRGYAEKFDGTGNNLLFSGAPGLGKTFLSASIARVVAGKGYSVAYDTASGLLSAFEQEKFSRGEEEQADAASRVRQLKGCDLLILDDLGTEMSTSFTQSALYALLDGRLRGGKSTVISTNLDREALSERYSPQLSSRLTGEYLWLTFLGRDIRAQRKERQ